MGWAPLPTATRNDSAETTGALRHRRKRPPARREGRAGGRRISGVKQTYGVGAPGKPPEPQPTPGMQPPPPRLLPLPQPTPSTQPPPPGPTGAGAGAGGGGGGGATTVVVTGPGGGGSASAIGADAPAAATAPMMNIGAMTLCLRSVFFMPVRYHVEGPLNGRGRENSVT
jgi:hypothetical protein